MENSISKKPTNEIISEMSFLDQEIYLKTMKYNLLSQELLRRFPYLAKEETFKEKEIIIKK